MRRRLIGNMIGQPAASGGILDSFVHVWDFTNIAAGSVPDIISTANLTAGGTYSADSTGMDLTGTDGYAEISTASLDINVGTSDWSLLVAYANVDTEGPNDYGRWVDTYDGSGDCRIWCGTGTTEVRFGNGTGSTNVTVTNYASQSAGAMITDAGVYWVRIAETTNYNETGLNGNMGGTLCFGNRKEHDRSMDALLVAGGLIDSRLTESEFNQAIAEMLAL